MKIWSNLKTTWKNPSESTHLLIFAEGKLDSKRRLVKLLKRDAQIIEAATPKEQEVKRYFAKPKNWACS